MAKITIEIPDKHLSQMKNFAKDSHSDETEIIEDILDVALGDWLLEHPKEGYHLEVESSQVAMEIASIACGGDLKKLRSALKEWEDAKGNQIDSYELFSTLAHDNIDIWELNEDYSKSHDDVDTTSVVECVHDKTKVAIKRGRGVLPYPWVEGTIVGFENYTFQAKIFDVGSKYGIGNGRISKLAVKKWSLEVMCYSRGWGSKPRTEEQKKVQDFSIRAS